MINHTLDANFAYHNSAWQYEVAIGGGTMNRRDYPQMPQVAVNSHLDQVSEKAEKRESVESQVPRDRQGPLYTILLAAAMLITLGWLTATMDFRSQAHD